MVEKRNIVLITLDSLRADHCSFMGYRRKTTPILDKMARKGLYFTNALSASIPTPHSMFSIFTGRYTSVDFYCRDFRKWREEFRYKLTLAQSLAKKGYYTLAVNPNPFASKIMGFNKGFKYFYDFGYRSNTFLYTLFKKVGFSEAIVNLILGEGTSIKCEKIIRYINKIKVNEPFFL